MSLFVFFPPLFVLQSDDAINPDRMYDLIAVVIHCGSGPNRGHYISIVKSCGFWLIFDDDIVDVRLHKSAWHTDLKLNVFFPFPNLPENRGFCNRGLLRLDSRHSEVLGDRIHSVLPVPRQQQRRELFRVLVCQRVGIYFDGILMEEINEEGIYLETYFFCETLTSRKKESSLIFGAKKKRTEKMIILFQKSEEFDHWPLPHFGSGFSAETRPFYFVERCMEHRRVFRKFVLCVIGLTENPFRFIRYLQLGPSGDLWFVFQLRILCDFPPKFYVRLVTRLILTHAEKSIVLL